jgi:AAA+ superfamily predicted ATPase
LRRRLASHIVFGKPELEERATLWQTMLDAKAPIEADIDYRALAEEFEDMSGANIRNAALSAAFLAADEGSSISSAHLQRAARSEYRAMGRVLTRGNRV